jgi:hypothetical protein
MKFLLFILSFIIFLFSFSTITYSYEGCAQIGTVISRPNPINLDEPFSCDVTVSSPYAGSETIACGISLDGKFPANLCPSDDIFGGWTGNTAHFNCLLPKVTKATTVSIVGYDFKEGCGLDTGKRGLLPYNGAFTGALTQDDVLKVVRAVFTALKGQKPQIVGLSPTSIPVPSISLPHMITSKTSYINPSLSKQCLLNKVTYEKASQITGVDWNVLAGIHYREGDCGINNSLVSGRKIGSVEPDIGANCSSQSKGAGAPIPLGGGCGFTSLLDSAIYAGKHVISKIGKQPSSFEDLAKALSRYNGGGNSNCNKTPFAFCPSRFEGDDDTYVMNSFDASHTPMYIVYCADYTKCNPPKKDDRPGAATTAMSFLK